MRTWGTWIVFGCEIPKGSAGFDISMSAIFNEANGSLRGTLFRGPGFLGFDIVATEEGGRVSTRP